MDMKRLLLLFLLLLCPACQALSDAKRAALINQHISDTDDFLNYYAEKSNNSK